jgi:outer membrane receptor for ferric coprogen and ferric-rhodotorulic acid
MKPLRAVIAGAILLMSASASADGDSVEELQNRVKALQEALAESQRALEAERAARSAVAPTAEPVPAPAPENTGAADPGSYAPEATVAADAEPGEQQLDAVVIRGQAQQPLVQLKEVPASISVVTGQELENTGATDITQVLNRIGNVNFNYGNPRTGSLTLRGITTGSSDQIDPTIGTVLDGISLGYTPLANGYPFVDIETVAVTRGPTGTIGGKPSNIGRISFTTKAPTFSPEASVAITYGDRNTLKATAIAGGPVVDGLLAWRGTFLREQGEGSWETHFPDLKGRGSYQNVDRTFGRVQFLLTPSADFKAKLSYEHQPHGAEWVNGLSKRHPESDFYSDGTARPVGNVNSAFKKYQRDWFNKDPVVYNADRDYYLYPVNVDNNGAIMTGSKGATLNMDWKVAGHTLQSITGWREHWFSAANDEGTPFDITKSGGYITTYRQKSQEFRLTSEPSPDKDKPNLVDYVVGLYWLSTDNDSLSRTRRGNDAGAYYANDAQYAALNANGYGQAMLRDSLNLTYTGLDTFVKNESFAAYGQADWHLTRPLTLKTGARIGWEDRATSQENVLYDPGTGSEFSRAFGITNNTTTVVDPGAADNLARSYFGAGADYASLTLAQQQQLQAAAAIRNAQLGQGSHYAKKKAKPWRDRIYAWDVSLVDEINDDLTIYGTVQYGEKGGIAQINNQGKTSLVDKERTTGLELGFRSSLLSKTLTLNADVFVNELRDFQTTVNEFDPVATAANIASGLTGAEAQAYQSLVGNLPKVRVKGLEIDAFYTGIKDLSLRLAASYNDARYADDTWLNQPSEVHYGAGTGKGSTFNAKGDTLNNAPKYTAIIGADYRRPVLGDKVFHASANYKWTSSYKTGTSSYDKQKAFGLLDLGIGIGRQDGLYDLNIIVRNALDDDHHVEGWSSYTPANPRWYGAVFSAHF